MTSSAKHIPDGFHTATPYLDVVSLLAAEMKTVDMVADNPGTWMFHCHFSEHLEAGMHAHYQVKP